MKLSCWMKPHIYILLYIVVYLLGHSEFQSRVLLLLIRGGSHASGTCHGGNLHTATLLSNDCLCITIAGLPYPRLYFPVSVAIIRRMPVCNGAFRPFGRCRHCYSGPLFTKRSGVLPQDPVKSQSRIPERYDYYNTQSRGLETSQELAVRRLTA